MLFYVNIHSQEVRNINILHVKQDRAFWRRLYYQLDQKHVFALYHMSNFNANRIKAKMCYSILYFHAVFIFLPLAMLTSDILIGLIHVFDLHIYIRIDIP